MENARRRVRRPTSLGSEEKIKLLAEKIADEKIEVAMHDYKVMLDQKEIQLRQSFDDNDRKHKEVEELRHELSKSRLLNSEIRHTLRSEQRKASRDNRLFSGSNGAINAKDILIDMCVHSFRSGFASSVQINPLNEDGELDDTVLDWHENLHREQIRIDPVFQRQLLDVALGLSNDIIDETV